MKLKELLNVCGDEEFKVIDADTDEVCYFWVDEIELLNDPKCIWGHPGVDKPYLNCEVVSIYIDSYYDTPPFLVIKIKV